ncbi:RUS family member 1 isoform X2 [Patagioenas fasciata]|uniref:RUS family member 1 isoform X2 n=1 Tax=Patagioenas fasciata TaxID=372321 RepID=UPI003A996EF4
MTIESWRARLLHCRTGETIESWRTLLPARLNDHRELEDLPPPLSQCGDHRELADSLPSAPPLPSIPFPEVPLLSLRLPLFPPVAMSPAALPGKGSEAAGVAGGGGGDPGQVPAGPAAPGGSPTLCRELWGPREAARYRGDPRGRLRRDETGGAAGGAWRAAQRVLLPQGFPESVSSDYLSYQLWDALQALCSSLAGAVAARSVLQAVGVGDTNANVTGAALGWLLRDGVGMVTRISFTWWQGSRLDCEAKQWRLAADVINDVALLLEMLAPHWPPAGPALLTLATAAKCVVGVAGGATRASLVVHQAQRDNVADVAAKDGSQETLVNGVGLILALLLLPLLDGRPWVTAWAVSALLVTHLLANVGAVRCLRLRSLNRPRLRLALRRACRGGASAGRGGASAGRGGDKGGGVSAKGGRALWVPSPAEVNPEEPLLPGFSTRLTLHLGAPLHRLVQSEAEFKKALECGTENYIIVLRPSEAPGSVPWGALAESSRLWGELGPRLLQGLAAAGWDTRRHLLALDQWQLEWDKPRLL